MAMVLSALIALQEGQGALQEGQVALQVGQEALRSDLDALRSDLIARVETLAVSQSAMRADFLAELGKTRSDLMDRMQNVRDDVTVNLAAANIAERAAKDALDKGQDLTVLVMALTRQVRQLQDTVNAMRGGGGH